MFVIPVWYLQHHRAFKCCVDGGGTFSEGVVLSSCLCWPLMIIKGKQKPGKWIPFALWVHCCLLYFWTVKCNWVCSSWCFCERCRNSWRKLQILCLLLTTGGYAFIIVLSNACLSSWKVEVSMFHSVSHLVLVYL